MSYSAKLKNPKWQRRRLEILQRDNWTCQICNDTTTFLNVHHLKYSGEPWEAVSEDLTTLCEHCHNIISEEKIDLLQEKHITAYKIFKPETIFIFFIHEGGLRIYSLQNGGFLEGVINISHETLKKIIHSIINYWLITENQHLLTDNSVKL